MHVNSKMVGAGIAAAIAAGIGYVLLNGEEEPEFVTVAREGLFSVRDYPALVVAETLTDGRRETALSRGFMTLADYVFGKDRAGGGRIPMTAPVLADGDEDGRGWRTRFIMPQRFTPEMLPVPERNDVRIRTLPARRLAAVRFTGDADDDAIAQRERVLREWMATRAFSAAGPLELAFYNSPFVPGPMRRNEVLIPLAA